MTDTANMPSSLAFDVHRVQADTLSLLDRVHEDCFDHPIVPELAAACVASPDAVLMVAVAQVDGASLVIGQCLAAVQRHPDKPSELFIDDLGVAEGYRRAGVATQLVHAAIECGRQAGAKVLWVGVDPNNHGARAFYASVGLRAEAAEIFEREI